MFYHLTIYTDSKGLACHELTSDLSSKLNPIASRRLSIICVGVTTSLSIRGIRLSAYQFDELFLRFESDVSGCLDAGENSATEQVTRKFSHSVETKWTLTL